MILGQTHAIHKVLGKKLGLYPDSPADEAHAWQLEMNVQDFIVEIGNIETRAGVVEWMADGARGDKWFSQFNKALEIAGTGFFVGDKLTHADFAVYIITETTTQYGDFLSKHAKLKEHKEMMAALPNVKAYNATAPPNLPPFKMKK